MAVLLSWLLTREDLALRLVEGGEPESVAIDWVHSIELHDPTPWLHGGELVLTTGLRLPRARAEQVAYVRRLAAAGTAALAFGIGVRFATIPRALQEACAEHGLPLVEVPLPTPFVAVTRAIADRLAELQHESMQRTVRFQRRLTAAALRDGVRGVVRGLAAELAAGVLVLDDRHRPVEAARTAGDLAERVGTELSRLSGTRRTTLHVVDEHRSIEVHSLAGRPGVAGWLAVDTGESLASDERVLLNQALSLLALLRSRSVEVLELRRQVGSMVLDLLLDGRPATEYLRAFGFRDDDTVAVLVVRPEAGCTIADDLAGGLYGHGLAHLATVRDDALVVLARADEAATAAEQLSDASGRATVGVSAPTSSRDCATALAQAVQAAKSAQWRRESAGRYEALTLAHVLDDASVRERVGALTGASLDPLRGHPVLLESLETFLRTNGSWETASRSLGVHRHTLRNRMTRVEELTGLSLDVAENRAVLLLGLMSN